MKLRWIEKNEWIIEVNDWMKNEWREYMKWMDCFAGKFVASQRREQEVSFTFFIKKSQDFAFW